MKPTPLQIVKEKFGSREDLAGELAGMVDKMHGDESTDAVKSRLLGLSNPKLLRLYRVEQTVREQYGDKDKLVEHLIETRRNAGHTADDTFREKISAYTKARLLDMTRQKFGPKPEKLTSEQKQARKKGKKSA
ncbi:MAG: hypothetical protein AAFZ18_10715 [Myxococcota bacterium]